MQKLVLASGNRHKVAEISAMFASSGLALQVLPVTDFAVDFNPEENGDSLAANAAIKAQAAWRLTGLPCLADDTGLFVEALDGAPGIYAARYAGEGKSFADNNQKLLQALAAFRGEKRRARFVCHLTLALDGQQQIDVEEAVDGVIAEQVVGTQGFGYDPVFLVETPAGRKALAEMNRDEKNEVSHRARAVRAMVERIRGR